MSSPSRSMLSCREIDHVLRQFLRQPYILQRTSIFSIDEDTVNLAPGVSIC